MSSNTNIQHVGIGNILATRALGVPINQRSYSWTEKEIDDLWTDLKWAISEDESEYFLGTIVLTLPADPNSRPLVVDGQQRLASVTMLYAAMRDYLLKLGENEIARAIEANLQNRDTWSQEVTPKLELSSQDGLFFTDHVLSLPDSDKRKNAKVTKTSPDSHKRIAKAFRKLGKSIEDMLEGAPDPLKILRKWDIFLKKSAKLIVLEVEDESSAFQVFETLNDRGLDLAVTDLLKNYLFGKAGNKNLETVKHNWTTAASRLSDGGERVFKRFIHHFWSSKHGLTRERLLYKRIKENIKSPARALEFSAELAASATNYAAILNPSADIWNPMSSSARRALVNLQYLKQEQYKPLLLACMDTMDHNKPNELEKVVFALVSWGVRFRITQQLGSSKLEDFYGNGGKLVRSMNFQKAKDIISALKSKVPSNEAFRNEFKDFSEESTRISRYYLTELERALRKKKGKLEEFNADEDVNNLEHILPKEPDYNEWTSFNKDTAPVYVNRLGNQTILGKNDNRKLGNSNFNKKRNVFKSSACLLTQHVGDFAVWNDDAIDKHQEWLADIANDAWPIEG